MFSRNLGILDKKKQGFVRLDMNVGPNVSVVVYKGWSFKCACDVRFYCFIRKNQTYD